MSEEEPMLHLETANGDFEATRENSILFRFLGKLSMYDHAFFITDREEGQGFYLFSVSEVFEGISEYMMANDYEMHLNLRQVAECDLQAFDDMVRRNAQSDLDGGIPEDWLES